MISYRFKLISKKPHKKFRCPNCGKEKAYVRYVDTTTGEYLPEEYGKCNRENNCAYWLNPYKDGYYKKVNEHGNVSIKVKGALMHQSTALNDDHETSFVATDIFKHSLENYDNNNFVTFLNHKFGREATKNLIAEYFIGTSNHWNGATIFWQVDVLGNIRAGKIMLYDSYTGRRLKSGHYNYINWVHTVLKFSNFNLRQCLFGEHLLKKNPTKPVAIVESEKTAIIASAYFPKLIWLAAGSLNNLSIERCKTLSGKKVTLFPDLNGFEKWIGKAKEVGFNVSDFLESNATAQDKKDGLDLADYLIRFDYKSTLKRSFKAEFLGKEELLPEYQLQVWKDYERRGLSPIDAKQVVNDLMIEHGFTIAD